MLGGILGWNDPYLKSCFPDSKLHKSEKLLLLRNKNLRFIEKQRFPHHFCMNKGLRAIIVIQNVSL